jgi:ribosomal subunit interface protein
MRNIKIIGENITVTDAIANYIREKFNHVNFPEKVESIELKIGKTHHEQYVNFFATINNPSKVVKITVQDVDMYNAIDEAVKKIQRSFVKIKDLSNLHLENTDKQKLKF